MSILDRIFGRTNPGRRSAPHSQSHANSQPHSQSHPHSQLQSSHSQMNPQSAASQNSTRKELLRVVLRDTLTRHGIPAAWITADMLVATSRQREPGLHWRLSIKHWDERLMTHTVALQNNLIRRVLSFDPLATNWLMGISWQLSLDDESACPPMPHPGTWTSEHRAPVVVPRPMAPGPSGDVISGPVLISGGEPSPSGAREDLERLFAIRDADRKRHGTDDPPQKFAATEPAKLDRL